MSASRELVESICAAVRDERGELDVLIDEAVRRLAPLATTAEQCELRRAALAQMAGLGALDALVANPAIDEVLVNGDEVWIDRGGRLEPAGRLTGTSVEQVIERILAPIGRRVDRTTPIVDARLADGARVCAVVPPVAVNGSTLSIRRFSDDVRSLTDFTDAAGVETLAEVIAARCNVVVCGATSSGKTSLLAAIVDSITEDERLLVLEDTTELPCRAPHAVRLEARPATADGVQAVSLDDLVRAALRLRPDRLVVGEVRSTECLALVQAMNTGHDGSLSTCHANGPVDALLRLESLVLQAAPQWPLAAVRQQLARSLDVIVHVARTGRARRVTAVGEVVRPEPGERAAPPEVRLLGRERNGTFDRLAPLGRSRR